MNLLEVIKSGKRFYRASWSTRMLMTFEDVRKLSKESVLGEDWELEGTEITICYEDFRRACQTVSTKLHMSAETEAKISDYLEELQKELNL